MIVRANDEAPSPPRPRGDERFERVSSVVAAGLICRELSSAGVSILGRPRRDRHRVQHEYDGGYWADVLKERGWERCRTLEEFLVPAEDAWRICKVDNQFVRARTSDYYRYRYDRLRQSLENQTEPGSDLVELGSGYGANLFALAASNQWRRLVGLELSETGIAAGRAIADHFGLSDRVRFERGDLTDLSAGARGVLAGRVAFSYYSFEQIPRDTFRAVRNLIDAGVRRIVHIEPIAELLHWYSPKDLINYTHILRHDYQRTLLRTLRQLEADGALRILDVRRLYYAPAIRHDPALVAWEPMSTSSTDRQNGPVCA
jgi:SAM-dependent methyltransferase